MSHSLNHSLLSADRTTHLKIVSVALLGAILLVAIGITARLESSQTATNAAVVKAGTSAIYTRAETPPVR
jgi:hypothetical protein